MKHVFLFFMVLFLAVFQIQAKTIYVTPTGNASNTGNSFGDALDYESAISDAVAGDIILLQAGTYSIPYSASYSKGDTNTLFFTQSGTSTNPITMKVDGTGRAVFDFSFPNEAWVQDSFGFDITGDYWNFYGIDVTRAGYQGVYVKGDHNSFEFCRFFENRNTGLEINKGGSNTTVTNCDAYRNYDPKKTGSMADGFGPKQTQGSGNVFIGCRSWENSDDGFDLFDSPEQVILIDCWTFSNGVDVWNDGRVFNGHNMNGFKIGGNGAQGNHILKRCIVFDHQEKGFDQNGNTGGLTLYNCLAFDNDRNYGMGGSLNSGQNHIVKNSISLNSAQSDDFTSGTVQSHNTWNSGFSVSASDFKSVNVAAYSKVDRNADGSLPETDLFRLVSSSDLIDAGTDVGLGYNGTAPDLGAFETGSSAIQYTLSTSKTGNGTITIDPVGTSFDEGTVVTLTANPLSGESFEGWTGDKVSSAIEVTITMSSNKSVTANFSSNTNPIAIAYVTDPNGATYANDTKILPALKADGVFVITEVDGTNASNDYSSYDLVVISEVPNSAAAGMIDLKGIDKPVVMMKVHTYKTATGTWAWCTAGYGQNDTETNVVVSNTNHPIFTDVTFVNTNEVNILSSVVGAKGLTYMDPSQFTSGGSSVSSLASVKGNSSSVSIFEVPSGSTISGTTLTEDFIQIGINSSSFANVTQNGIQIVLNACHYLTDGISNAVTAVKEEGNVSISVVNEQLSITTKDLDTSGAIAMYNINGQMVLSSSLVGANTTISISDVPSGLYIVSVQTSTGVVTKKVLKN